MIFDSDEQKQRVIDLIGEAPINTDIKGLLSGPSPALMDLMSKLIAAHVMTVDEQTILLIEKEKKDRAAADLSDD